MPLKHFGAKDLRQKVCTAAAWSQSQSNAAGIKTGAAHMYSHVRDEIRSGCKREHEGCCWESFVET